jgi:uncharacterized membrane protein HdeD (DUF308 family)
MAGRTILGSISRNWWLLAVGGIAAVLFAIGAFLWPGLSLLVLLVLWGAYAIVDGVTAVIAGARARWWSMVFLGIVGIAAGLFALLRPGITALALLLVIAAWAIARGILEIVAAFYLRKELSNEWVLVVSGLLSITVGILFILFPGAGVLAMIWIIGLYILAMGVLQLILAFRLRDLHTQREPRLAV